MNAQDSDSPLTEAVAPEADMVVEKRRRAPRRKVEVPAGDTPPAPDLATGPAAEAVVEARQEPGAEAGNPSVDAEEGPTRDANRRKRNRRRGRRSGDAAQQASALGSEEGDAGEGMPEGGATEGGAAEAPRHLPQPEVGEVFANVLSGAYDAEAPLAEGEGLPLVPPKRVLAPDPDAPKLQKVLAQAGIGSRRDIEQLVQEGRITVNGEPAHVGQRISFGDQLRIDGRPIKARIAPPPPRVLAYHKPAGEVVTHDDPQHRPTVFRRLPRLSQGKWQSVGRLDINTEGLLLFTNSGELANQLMHPRFGVEREYAVRVLGVVDDAERERLLQGVSIDGQSCALQSIEEGGGEGANRWYRVVITEGRNREVRKLFEAVGHAVSRLIRVRYGSVVLPRGLRRGVWVDLDEADVWTLRRMARPQPRPGGEGAGENGPQGRADGERRNRRGGRKGRRRDAGDRMPRGEAAPGFDRPERAARFEPAEGGSIPNPLQQNFDKRAFQQSRARREINEDGPIPNPLQQTFDKRALQQERARRADFSEDGPIPNPLQQTYDKRFVQKAAGLNVGRGANRKNAGGGPRQPDPMQTAVGYIGADALARRGGGGRGKAGRGKQGRGGGRGR